MWECTNCKKLNNSCKAHIEHLLKSEDCLSSFKKANNIELFLSVNSLENWNKSNS